MAIELITGKGATPHVDSADVGAFQAYTVGTGIYILDGVEASVASANQVAVTAGEVLAEGRHVRLTGAGATLQIDSGQSGYKRNDIIAIRYNRDAGGIEDVSVVVIKGTPSSGTPADPAMPSTGKVLDNASTAYWPLYRIPIVGLAPQAPERISEANPLEMADRVTQEGTSGDWYFRKWASGKFECWMETGGLKSEYSYGAYKFVAATYSFPVEFKETPHISVTPYSATDLFTATIYSQSATQVGIRLCALANTEAWTLGNIYAIGEV